MKISPDREAKIFGWGAFGEYFALGGAGGCGFSAVSVVILRRSGLRGLAGGGRGGVCEVDVELIQVGLKVERIEDGVGGV